MDRRSRARAMVGRVRLGTGWTPRVKAGMGTDPSDGWWEEERQGPAREESNGRQGEKPLREAPPCWGDAGEDAVTGLRTKSGLQLHSRGGREEGRSPPTDRCCDKERHQSNRPTGRKEASSLSRGSRPERLSLWAEIDLVSGLRSLFPYRGVYHLIESFRAGKRLGVSIAYSKELSGSEDLLAPSP